MTEARAKLETIVLQFLNEELDVVEFCDAFERSYNFEVEKSDLREDERRIFQALFDEVVLYSPFDDDRKRYAGYRDDAQIRRAAIRARSMLDPRASS